MPHDKFYNMAAYERRMAMIRNGDTLAPETSTKEEKDEWDRKQLTYNFEQDERAHLARIRVSNAVGRAEGLDEARVS
jgi:ribosomal protein S6